MSRTSPPPPPSPPCELLALAAIFASPPLPCAAKVEKDEGDVTAAGGGKGEVGRETEGVALA